MSDELLEGAWRSQILDLVARYAHCVADGDFDGLESLFTEDARFGVVPDVGIIAVPMENRAAIRKALEQRHLNLSRTLRRRHLMATTVVDKLDESHATARTTLAVFSAPLSGGSLELLETGIYHDRLDRVDGSWLFAERVLHLDGIETS